MVRGVGGTVRPLRIYPSDSAPFHSPPPNPAPSALEGLGAGESSGVIYFTTLSPPPLQCVKVTLPLLLPPSPHPKLIRKQQETVRCIKERSGT
jgi:hypothetical protein